MIQVIEAQIKQTKKDGYFALVEKQKYPVNFLNCAPGTGKGKVEIRGGKASLLRWM